MASQQPSPNGIESRYKLNPNPDEIIDENITEYVLNYHASHVYFTGKIYFKNGKEKDVRFLKELEEDSAKNLFSHTSKIDHVGVLKPYFVTYYEPQKFWILCYDWFDQLLDELLMDEEDIVRSMINVHVDAFSWWCDQIRYLLQTLKHIHAHKFFHKSLDSTCNYVVVSQKIKIINVQSSFEDLQVPVNHEEVRMLRIKDLKAFRDMLKDNILMPKASWGDRDSFCDFFDYDKYEYPRFVEKLTKHPFLLKPAERMRCFFDIWFYLEHSDMRRKTFVMILNGIEFQRYKSWNDLNRMVPAFKQIYEHKDDAYKGESLLDLLRFLRNIGTHYMKYDISTEDVDSEVRKLYPNFLDKLYTHLI